MRVVLSLVLILAATASWAAKSNGAFPAQPLKVQDFEKLNVVSDSKSDVQFFARNLGLGLNEKSSVRNVFYASKNFKKWIFIQANLAVADKAEGEITTLPDGKSFFSVRGTTNFFVLTKGFERDELLKLRKDISSSPKGAFIQWLLLPQNALATGKCLSSQEVQQTVATNSESDFNVLKAFWACQEGKGNGVWNATGGVVTSTYHVVTKGTEQILCGAASLVDATWKRCSDYAAAMQNTVDSTLYTLGNIKQVSNEMVDDFSKLPVDVQIKVYCEMKTTLEASVAVGFVTAGAGAPGAFSRMAQVLNRVAEAPGMGKSSALLKSMATKVERKAQEKAAALAKVKSIPHDVQESLNKIENLKVEFASNSTKVTEYSQKLDSQWQAVENSPSRYATENMMINAEKRLESILSAKRSTVTEDKDLASQLLKYAKLTDKERDLANKVLSTNGTGIAKHEATDDIIQLAQSLKNSRLKLRDDLKFATSEEYTKLTRDYIALEEKRVRAMRATAASKEKLADEISRYWSLIDKKNLSQQDKDILKSQVSAYMTASLCNASSSIESYAKPIEGVR